MPPCCSGGSSRRGDGRCGRRPAIASRGLVVVLLVLVLAGLALVAAPPPGPAFGQSIDRGLFADTDSATRDVLAFLGGLGAHGPSAVGDMLFAFNAGVLVLAGFLLVWHAAAGTVDTAREGRFGFGAWAIVRIVTAAIALMAPLPGGMNGAQHAVIGLAHLGGDFANAVWKPFSEEALAESRPIVPRPREALWRAAISRTLIAETCMRAAQRERRSGGRRPLRGDRRGTRTTARCRSTTTATGAACRTACAARSASRAWMRMARRASRRKATAGRSPASCRPSVPSPPASPPTTCPAPRSMAARFRTSTALLARQDLAGAYARVLDDALTRCGLGGTPRCSRSVVAEDAREASWMAAASFFNTIAHRVGLFQAAAHNVPSVALPTPEPGRVGAVGRRRRQGGRGPSSRGPATTTRCCCPPPTPARVRCR